MFYGIQVLESVHRIPQISTQKWPRVATSHMRDLTPMLWRYKVGPNRGVYLKIEITRLYPKLQDSVIFFDVSNFIYETSILRFFFDIIFDFEYPIDYMQLSCIEHMR